jgi:hypothetical protein
MAVVRVRLRKRPRPRAQCLVRILRPVFLTQIGPGKVRSATLRLRCCSLLALPLRSRPATPEAFGRWGAACFTTLSECSPRHAPKRRIFPKSFRSRITEEPEPWRAKTGVHVRLMVVVRATDWRDLRERTEPKGRSLSVVKVKTRMIRISAAPHGSANSAPRPHRDGRTSNTQSHRPVT